MNASTVPSMEAIFRTHAGMVYRICRRYVKSEEDAKDLTQDVFLKLHRKLESFQGQSTFSTWLYRVTVNICLDHIRARKDQNQVDVDDFDEIVAHNLSSAGNVELARIDLERILKEVHPKTRELLFLVLAEGLSYADAGEMVGMEKSAVAKQITRFLASRSGKANPGKLGRRLGNRAEILTLLGALVHRLIVHAGAGTTV